MFQVKRGKRFEILNDENKTSETLKTQELKLFLRNKKFYMDLYCLKYFVFLFLCSNFLHEKYQDLVNIMLNIINH